MKESFYYFYIRRLIVMIFYLIPVALLFWFVASFSVNVPFLDHWTLVSLFDRIALKAANFGDFYAQNFEHRMLLPKVIFSILAFSSNWNVNLEQWFSIFLAILSFKGLYDISASRGNNNIFLFHLVNIASCMLFFSLVQYANWLWGFQLAWHLVNTCVILAIFILTVSGKLPPYLRISLAALCCFIASFSSAHGLMSWLAVIPSLTFFESNSHTKLSKIKLLLWVLLFIACGIIYSIGYQSSVGYTDKLFFLKKPLVSMTFLVMLVGASVGQVINPAISGFVILLNFLYLNIHYFKNPHSKFARDAAPWLSLSWFAILFALITTIGRVEGGIGYSLLSRYTSVSILLVISSLQMWRLLICHKSEWLNSNNSTRIISICCFFFGFYTAIFMANSTAAIAEGKNLWLQQTSGKDCIEVIHYLDKSLDELPESCLSSITIHPNFKQILRDSVESLNRLGFRSYSKDISFLTRSNQPYGSIEFPPVSDRPFTLPINFSIKLSGWATLPSGGEQPRVVLFSYGNEKSFFANAVVKLPRPDVGRQLKLLARYSKIGWDRFGWEVNIPAKYLPLGENTIKAWVYDRDNKQFVQLNGTPKIKVIND